MLNPFASVQTAPNAFSVVNFIDGNLVHVKTKQPVSDIWLNIFPTKTRHDFKVRSITGGDPYITLVIFTKNSSPYNQNGHKFIFEDHSTVEYVRSDVCITGQHFSESL